MCGIVAAFAFRGEIENTEVLERLLGTLAHRGPDDATSWQSGPFFLGHRRLSIIDIQGGAQPMATPDGEIVVAFNGEIYNYLELREELEGRGHVFETHSDTEVLLHGYREWGEHLPVRLVGMFAFAIADRRNRQIFLARDRFGEKPLFYIESDASVLIASEVKALAAMPGFPRRLNGRALASYLCLNYVPGEDTLIEGVLRFPPGGWRCYGPDGRVRSGSYWTPSRTEASVPNLDEALERLAALLDRSVALSLRSDVPVGIFLSGGIDSSLIARSASRSGKLAKAYCLTFEESSYSEWENANETARQLGIPIERIVLGAESLEAFLDIVEHADDPLADSSALAVWTISRQASRELKVVLGGDGGDELFGGYLTYPATALHRQIVSRLPIGFRRAVAGAAERLPTSERKVSLSYKLRRFLRAAPLPTPEAHFSWNGTWLPEKAAGFLSLPELQAEARTCLASLARRCELPSRPSLRDLQIADLREYLPNDILAKVDRMSMAHGLEVRAPFLNPELAEFALSLPEALKAPVGGEPKKILRVLAARYYGVALGSAKKQGFSIPIHAWLRGPGRELVQDLLCSESVRRLEVLEPLKVAGAVNDHMSGRRSYGFELWGLMVFAAWHRARIQNAPALGSGQRVRRLSFPLLAGDRAFQASPG